MKSTFKIQNTISKLNEDLVVIAELEKDIRFCLRMYYKERIEGKSKLYLTIYLFVKHKRPIKPSTVPYTPTIVEDLIMDIDSKLNTLN
jgi:hypothetical protein